MEKKRIVVKIGSSSLTNDYGEIDEAKLQDHVEALANLKLLGHEVLLVSSGAVAAGFKRLGYQTRPVTLKGRQAAAAVGQSLLIQSYIAQFDAYDVMPAQILVTRDDFTNRARFKNAYETMSELLERNILPIINENDTVSVRELTFGDNDMLSALVAGFMKADQLIILTDVNGLYTDNPMTNPNAKKINVLTSISDDLLLCANEEGSKVGTGGMKSKLLAAKTALKVGIPVFIGTGEGKEKLVDIVDGKGDGTYLLNEQHNTITINQQWIAMHAKAVGQIYIDAGAEAAILYNSKNLLPAGITKFEGKFNKGDIVEVFGKNGLIGKGEVTISAKELAATVGKKTCEQTERVKKGQAEVIHRSKWVVI